MKGYTATIAGHMLLPLSESIPWDELNILAPTFLVDPNQISDIQPPDILICDVPCYAQWQARHGGNSVGTKVILYSTALHQERPADVSSVLSSTNSEQYYAALKKIVITLHIEDANRTYYHGRDEAANQPMLPITLEDFWGNVLVDSSVLRSAEEYAAAALSGGISLCPDEKYVLSMFIIYSHRTRFENWKPNALEAVSKQLISDIMECRCIPVLEVNRTLYYTIHPLTDGIPANFFAERCERVTSSFLDEWGMNVFTASGVPAAIHDLWRQRIQLMLEFDQFYSAIGRNATATLVENVRFLVENAEHGFPSRSDLASRLGFHPDYLSRVFHQQAGKTLMDYLDEVRLRRAKQMLCDRSLPISEIASELGYSNFSSFTQMFRRNTGYSPSTYRKQYAIMKP